MSSLKFLPPMLLAITLVAASAAFAKSVTVTNNTTYTMTQLYASSTYHSSDWSSSTNLLLNGQSIGPGQSASVPVSDGTAYCHYDFMGVLYGAAQYAYQYTIDTCDSGNNSWSVSQ